MTPGEEFLRQHLKRRGARAWHKFYGWCTLEEDDTGLGFVRVRWDRYLTDAHTLDAPTSSLSFGVRPA